MSGVFPVYCKKRIRDFLKERPRLRLPLNHRYIDKLLYYQETYIRAWKYHLHAHGLHIPEPVLRKLCYDALFEALENKNGKIHHKDFITEYNKFKQIWDTQYQSLHQYLQEWESYKNSDEFKAFKEQVKELDRFQKRARAHLSNALAFAYAKYQMSWTEWGLEIERKLLGWVETAWSKKWLWFLTTLLVFDANDLYANTLGKTRYIERRYDWEQDEAIKIHVQPWWDREELEIDSYYKLLAKTYKYVTLPMIGEVGSVLLTDLARRGTVHALLFATDAITTIAYFHPALRTMKWGATLIETIASILDKSILAWLGWQIGVEWQVDGMIQAVCNNFLKYLYAAKTGTPLWKLESHPPGYIFEMAVKALYMIYETGKAPPDFMEALDWVKKYGTAKQRLAIDRIEHAIANKKRLEYFRKMYKAQLEKLKTVEHEISDRLNSAIIETLQKQTEEMLQYLNTITVNSYKSLKDEILELYATLAKGAGYTERTDEIIRIAEYNLDRTGGGQTFLFDDKMLIVREGNKLLVDFEISNRPRRWLVTEIDFAPWELEKEEKGELPFERLKLYLWRLTLLLRDIVRIQARSSDRVLNLRLETLGFMMGFHMSYKLRARLRGKCMSVQRLSSVMRSKEVLEDLLQLQKYESRINLKGYFKHFSYILEYSHFVSPMRYEYRNCYVVGHKFLKCFYVPAFFYDELSSDKQYCTMYISPRQGIVTGQELKVIPQFYEDTDKVRVLIYIINERLGHKFNYVYIDPPYCPPDIRADTVGRTDKLIQFDIYDKEIERKYQYRKGKRSKIVCLR